ncbi:hypothetical protein NIES4102_21830 [Chondrocystis sp. NIES-4102]|nr:hypothetical protein NIES4102_21830 [Chondrocystis sp. NIES-4102]
MKNTKSQLSIFGITLSYLTTILCTSALADQCAYITKEQAQTAVSRLNLDQTIYSFCEPCGDKIPQPMTIERLGIETVDYQDFWQVKVNNGGIDLAYIFIDSGVDGNFLNLAAVANCQATQVSPIISPQIRGNRK